MYIATVILIQYSRKIWRRIKFGCLVVYITTAKLKSAKISYSHVYMYVWQSRTEPPNLNPPIFCNSNLGLNVSFIWARRMAQITNFDRKTFLIHALELNLWLFEVCIGSHSLAMFAKKVLRARGINLTTLALARIASILHPCQR